MDSLFLSSTPTRNANTTPRRISKKYDSVKSRIDSSTPKSILIKSSGASGSGTGTPSKSGTTTRNETPKKVAIITPRTEEREKEFREEIDKLRTQVELYKNSESQLKITVTELEKELDSKARRIQQLELENMDMQYEYFDTENSLELLDASASAQTSIVPESAKRVAELLEKINHIQLEKEEELKKLSDSYDNKLIAIQSQLSLKSQDVINLRTKLEESRVAREDLINLMTHKSQQYDEQIKLLQNETENVYLKVKESKIEQKQFQYQIDEMEKKFRQASQDSLKYSVMLEESRTEVLEKKEEISSLRNRILSLENRLENNLTNIQTNSQDLLHAGNIKDINQLLEAQLLKTQSSLETVKDELLELKHVLKDVEKQLQHKIEELNSTKIDLRIAKRETADLENKLKESNKENLKLKEKYQQLETSKEELENAAHLMNQQFKQTEFEIRTKSSEVKLNEGKVANLQSKIEELEIQLNEKNEAYVKVTNHLVEVENLKLEEEQKVVKMNLLVKKLKEACLALEQQNAEMEEEIIEEQEKLKRMESITCQKDDEIDHYKMELRKLKETLREALEWKEKLEESKKQLEHQFAIQENHFKSDVQRVQHSNQILQQELNTLNIKIHELTDELNGSRKKIQELEHEVKYSNAYLLDTQIHRSEKITENSELVQQIKKLTKTKKLLEDQVAHLESDVRKLTQEIHNSTVEYGLLDKISRESKHMLEEQLKQKTKLIELLQSKVAEMEAKHKPLFEKFLNRENKSAISSWRGVVGGTSSQERLSVQEEITKIAVAPCLPRKESMKLLKNASTRKVIYYQEGTQKLEVTCVQQLANQNYLIGSNSGLYLLERQNEICQELVKIGFEPITDVIVIPEISRIVYSEGENGKIRIVPLDPFKLPKNSKKLKTLVKDADVVSKSSSFFRVKFCQKTVQTFLANIQSNKIDLLHWKNIDQKYCFTFKNSIRVENVTSLHMGSESLVFVADKLYEADYQFFERAQIFDELDQSLDRITACTNSSLICPIEVFIIAEEPELEYLVCFQEFGVFINSEGKRSRDFIEWSRRGTPKSFALRSKYLYIIWCSGVEVLTIQHSSFKNGGTAVSEWKFIPNVSLLNFDMTYLKNSVYVASFRPNEIEVLEISPKESEF